MESANHIVSEKSNKGMNEVEKTTLVSSKRYKVVVRLVQSNDLHHLVTQVLDTETDPDLFRTYVILTFFTSFIMQTNTSLWSAGGTTFKIIGVASLLTDFGGEADNIAFEVVPILATKTITGTAFIDKSVKSNEPERRQIFPRVC